MQLTATAPALPCDRIAKALATGTVFERNRLAKEVTAPPEQVAEQCNPALRKGFQDPLRAYLPKPSMQAWEAENQWFAAFLRSTRPAEASYWLARIDPQHLPQTELSAILATWGSANHTAALSVLDFLARYTAKPLSNQVLHSMTPALLALEASTVTDATRAAKTLDRLGFRFLTESGSLAQVWELRFESAPAEVTQAELRMADGDAVAAFNLYTRAAKVDMRYLVHAAILAESLLTESKLDGNALLSAGIPFRKCQNGYGVNWGSEKLRPQLFPAAGELQAEIVMRTGNTCQDENELDVDELEQRVEKLPAGLQNTLAGKRQMLVVLARMADDADRVARQGYLHKANAWRLEIWNRARPLSRFTFLTGPTRARGLADRVAGHIPLPPEPIVYINEPPPKPDPEDDPSLTPGETEIPLP